MAYSSGIELPYTLERARDTTITCPVYGGGVLAIPASGTCTLADPAGTAVSTGAVTITNGVATYSVTSASLTSKTYGDGWQVTWALVMPDTITHSFRTGASIVKCGWSPNVTDASLYRRSSALDPNGAAPITTIRSYQPYIDEAGLELQRRLLQQGRRPWLIVDPTELREPHLLLSLALIYEDLSSRLNAAYIEQARMYRQQFADSWNRVRFTYDVDGDGIGDGRKKPGARGAVWLTSRA